VDRKAVWATAREAGKYRGFGVTRRPERVCVVGVGRGGGGVASGGGCSSVGDGAGGAGRTEVAEEEGEGGRLGGKSSVRSPREGTSSQGLMKRGMGGAARGGGMGG